MPEPVPSPDDLFTLRMLVLVECPGGHFHQVALSKEQFLVVWGAVSSLFPTVEQDDDGEVTLRGVQLCARAIPADTFEGLEESYEDGEVELMEDEDEEED